MEDDKLQELFGGFDPELTSDLRFMDKLQRNMEAVEVVRQHSAAVRRRNRVAVCVAALAGFVMGVVMTLLMPVVSGLLAQVTVSLPAIGLPTVHMDLRIIGWMTAAALSGVTAWNAYEITLSRMKHSAATR